MNLECPEIIESMMRDRCEWAIINPMWQIPASLVSRDNDRAGRGHCWSRRSGSQRTMTQTFSTWVWDCPGSQFVSQCVSQCGTQCVSQCVAQKLRDGAGFSHWLHCAALLLIPRLGNVAWPAWLYIICWAGGEGVKSPGSCGSNDTSLVASLFILQIVRGFNVLFWWVNWCV